MGSLIHDLQRQVKRKSFNKGKMRVAAIKNRTLFERNGDDPDIRYAESYALVDTVHTRSGPDIGYYDTLDKFYRLCDDERVLRCHKSFLVNLDYVRSIMNAISKSLADVKARDPVLLAKSL